MAFGIVPEKLITLDCDSCDFRVNIEKILEHEGYDDEGWLNLSEAVLLKVYNNYDDIKLYNDLYDNCEGFTPDNFNIYNYKELDICLLFSDKNYDEIYKKDWKQKININVGKFVEFASPILHLINKSKNEIYKKLVNGTIKSSGLKFHSERYIYQLNDDEIQKLY